MNRLIVIIFFISSAVKADDIFTNEFEQNTATRIKSLTLVDPHPFADLPVFGCGDATAFLNTYISDSLNNDDDGDGYIDDSIITQFYTDQPDYLTSRALNASLWDADCPDPLHSGTCQPVVDAVPEQLNTAVVTSGMCLGAIPGTISSGGYTPAVNDIMAPCYATEPKDILLYFLDGNGFPLAGFQQADEYSGGLNIDKGLVRGFISEAGASLINFSVLFNGNTYTYNLAESLPGHPANCETLDTGLDDRDVGPDGITQGWWLYFNTTSELVEFSPQLP